MAYKNIDDRKAASRWHYEANKFKYMERNKKYRASIQSYVHELKEKMPCADCGINYPYYVMDSDHMENKENVISYLSATGRIGALKREVDKRELVCANCHRMRTHKRSRQVVT